MDKLKSISKKLVNLDLQAYEEGVYNFKNPEFITELVAVERAKVCAECEHNEEEPIKRFQVEDKNIPAISKRSCGVCGCILPYLLRQNVKPCELNKWK